MRLSTNLLNFNTKGVSIHAPVKGATVTNETAGTAGLVSIHAPVKGATRFAVVRLLNVDCFNSRTRKGCDGGRPKKGGLKQVSIHAPVKGATSVFVIQYSLFGFQFRHP